MKKDMNKLKKKRKIHNAAGEILTKKNKSEIHENNDNTKPALDTEISEKPVEIPQEEPVESNRKAARKKEKRKLAEASESSINETKPKINGVDVPSKKSKNASTDSSIGHDQQCNGEAAADASDDDVTDKTKVSTKEASKLTAKSFRKSFSSKAGIDALRKFLTICQENKERDLIAEYLQAGGSILEILKMLDTSDKKNANNASLVFTVMHQIIMKILAEYPQHQSRAEEACRHLINSHLSFVHSMFSSQSNAKQRKIVLRLLASMVSLGGSLPRELLAHLSFHSQVLDTLSQQTKPTDSQSVRTCFIHFVLAFLVENNTPVIRALLDKRGMLSCIFPDLVYDSHTTVHLVLNTIKTYVLENNSISKTSKLHVFSTPVLQNLVSLYNWKGPKQWPGPKGKKRETTNDTVHPDEKEVAVEAVHDFLITLLTSNRHGVIFHDRSLGTSGKKCNQLVNTILQSLDRPWEHSRPLDLVVRVLVACPDLIRSQLIYTEPFLEPRVSNKWILVMRFVGKVIQSLDAESCLKPCLPDLAGSQLVSAVVTLTAPTIVLKNAIVPSLNHSHTILRQEAVVLLTTMLKQVKAFTTIVENNCQDVGDFVAFKHAITDYISKNVPCLESILKVWNLALVPESEVDIASTPENVQEFIPKRHVHFAAILDLLQAYRDVCPERMDIGASGKTDIQPLILLTGLNGLTEVGEEALKEMKVKALEFLLDVDPTAFGSNTSLFGKTLSFLISLLHEIPNEIDSHSRKTIKMLLTASGMFEGCVEQMEIWINAFARLIDQEERHKLAKWFVKVMHHAIKHTDKYLGLIVEAEEIAGEQIVPAGRLEDIFNEMCEREMDGFESRAVNMLPSITISPLVCSALENVKTNSTDSLLKYLSHVTILTLHYQVSPGALIHLTKDIESFPAKKYLNSWLQTETPVNIKKIFPPISIITKFSKILLSNEIIVIANIFEGNRLIEFEYQGKKITFGHNISEYEVKSLLRMTLFYLTQFLQRNELTQEQFDKYKICIVALLHVANDLNGAKDSSLVEDCSRTIFMNPIILQCFSPLEKSKNNVEKIVTNGLLDICKVVDDLNDDSTLPDLFMPFKNKFISQLRSCVKTYKNAGKVKNFSSVTEFIDYLRPSIKDINDTLRRITELPKERFVTDDKTSLSIWAIVVSKLIELLTLKKYYLQHEDNSTIDTNFVKKIVSYLTQLKANYKIETDVLESSLHKFLFSYPHYIIGIDTRAFNSLLEHCTRSTSINFAAFLVSRNSKYISQFIKFVCSDSKILERNDLIFAIIASNLTYKWDLEFLGRICNHYKKDIINYFADPTNNENWVSKNVEATVYIIETCFVIEDCANACESVLSNGDKLDNVNLSYVKLLETLFKKSSELENNQEDSLTKLLQVLIRITVSALKKDSKNEEKLVTLCQSLCDTIALLKSKNNDFVFENLNKNYAWPQFTRFSLKMGLKSTKDENKYVPLLKTLVNVCDVAYRDGSENEYVKTMFEMTTSHSEFVNLMLSSHSVKKDLLELLWILIRKNHSVMASSHIPLYLAAYNATLSESDQIILLILRHYESHNIKLNEYRPYLWGDAAATYYSVKGEADTALWRQPTTSQVIDLFNFELIKETIQNFPVHRILKPTQVCEASKVYDPSFYLPLLTYLLSDNNVVACHKVTQSGVLALVFAACGSTCAETRLAACTVISRFYFHLEASSSKEKLLWIRFIDALRNGIINLDSSLIDVRLSCLVSTFLARASIVTTQPMNPLYSPIQTFLMAKPAMELNTIPELLQLFHSSEIDHKAHRHWILEVIRDGMKTDFDTELALKCVLFKMLLDFYSSALSDVVTKRLILEIIESTVKNSKAGLLLCREYGLLTWLNEIATHLSSTHDFNSTNLVVSIIRELLDSVLKTNNRDSHVQFMLLNVLRSLLPSLTKNTSITCFAAYSTVLSKIVQTKTFREYVTQREIANLVELGNKIFGDVDDVMNCLRYGNEFAGNVKDAKSNDDEISMARTSLRQLVFTWADRGPR